MTRLDDLPVILSFAHLDPTGAGGLQADIECAASLGCHCTTVATSLVTKDTRQFVESSPVETSQLVAQSRAILEDFRVSAIKIGLTGSLENTEAIHTVLQDYPNIPVILDPVLNIAGQGLDSDNKQIEAICALLVPQVHIVIARPSAVRQMAKAGDSLSACAHQLLEMGADYTLICGANNNTESFGSQLYNAKGLLRSYSWERINALSHGGSATLSASTTCYIAHQLMPEEAILQAQNFTRAAIQSSRRLGMGHLIPHRMFWASEET